MSLRLVGALKGRSLKDEIPIRQVLLTATDLKHRLSLELVLSLIIFISNSCMMAARQRYSSFPLDIRTLFFTRLFPYREQFRLLVSFLDIDREGIVDQRTQNAVDTKSLDDVSPLVIAWLGTGRYALVVPKP
ncbi:hypothetical protein [Pectobacterium peruviense]|uniref:hypothetical protein n=1 Tax=Pectobacterium peruviense TaxID=2066479 RepID=UPI0011AB7263|nr:hypothetical protein [Pectobacterium peruviense]